MLRSATAALTGLLAAVLLPLSIASVWVDRVVSDTDRYVETVTPLADDDAVKAAAVTELQNEALRLAASSGTTLPPGAAKLVHTVVTQVVDSPAFRTAWAQANRSAHDQLVAVLEDRSSVVLDQDGRVSIQLGTVLGTIVQALAAKGLVDPARLPEINASFPVMDSGQLARARDAYDLLDGLGFWLPVAWAVLVLLTLLLARRRLTATAKLALASLLTLGLLALALAFARDTVTEDLPQRDVATAVWDVVVASLWREIEVAAGVLVVVAIAAGSVGGLRGFRDSRRAAPSTSDGGL
jgi:hypothetical protein